MGLSLPRKTGKWARPGFPKTGWVCEKVENGGGTTCEMCEVACVVYVHIMRHERYPLALYCGCDCAGHMSEAPAVEILREALYRWKQRQLAERTPIEKLRRKGWSFYPNLAGGPLFVRRVEIGDRSEWTSFHVRIGQTDEGGWCFQIEGRHADPFVIGAELFESELSAALAGIEETELLLANVQWVAAWRQRRAEERAQYKAEEEAKTRRYVVKEARRCGCGDVAELVEAGTLEISSAWAEMNRRRAAGSAA